ncbi:GNAT superfamily N-acetyltransferase [Methanomicrobium sp. W14]|uniref:N-acetyltransferase n=1 Tax=Methanomicrobium sp. W14 TaxID=2817839 RepID=UPI001AE4A462|nr:N-acetyltransferase [Methanomicrobium sp. W14]MBP2134186.1 GNAT superfamily N-acetyltransferase [Methanomicrobium sp. W14]
MSDVTVIDLTPENIAEYGVCGYKDVKKHVELRRKIDWFKKYYPKGLRIKAVLTKEGEYQGMLEYMPGRYAHRPVDAGGYMFIQCIFVGFRKEFKGHGYASSLIDACISDAKNAGMKGVAVVTRKGPFMAKKDIFVKKGFVMVDEAKPDFELMALKFDPGAENPSFKADIEKNCEKYPEGLSIFRSAQCPYSEKNVAAIMETASEKYGIKARLVEMEDEESVQNAPSPFGTFCIMYNGKVISHHPISNTRFENIMDKIIK